MISNINYFLESRTLLCLQSDFFCKPTVKHPNTVVPSPQDLYLVFSSLNSLEGFLKWLTVTGWKLRISLIVLGRTMRKLKKACQQLKFFPSSPLGTNILNLTVNSFCNETTQMHTTRYTDLFISYRKSLEKTGNRNPIVVDGELSFSQNSLSSPWVFDSVKIKCPFPLLNGSSSLRTVNYDADIKTTIEFSINHVFIFMTI